MSQDNKPRGPGRRGGLPGRTAGFWLLLLLLVFMTFQMMSIDRDPVHEISWTAFKNQVEVGNIRSLTKTNREVEGELVEPTEIPLSNGSAPVVQRFRLVLLAEDPAFPEWVREHNPEAYLRGDTPKTSWLSVIVTYYLPFLLILVLWLFFIRQMQGGSNKAFSFGKSKAKLINMDKPTVTFQDVAGCDEAKYELQEIIDFLRSPKKFQRLGGRIPKGALLVGSPGTGKTLLARAVAGEAGVPFFSMSGSDFVEMFVGVGASRVRDLFEQGKKNAPCIIFIDEIDAVGRHRGAGLGGGHDEREQTLNQLLVEMDGFESNEGVILVAATNRPDVLDPALMRPGRFDRRITVDVPDLNGREAILRVHMRRIRMADDIEPRRIAAGTSGLAGADLENLVNEAALLAARKNRTEVTMDDFWDAREKVMMGPERRSLILSDEDKRITAYHEAGHAVLAQVLEHASDTEKVTIVPRGQALGLTFTPPEKDEHHQSRSMFLDRICMALGGRVAEEIFIGEIHTGAYSDINMVSDLARTMVTRVGMSDLMGPISYAEGEEQVFLGREYGRRKSMSERTLQLVDDEVKRIVSEQYERARSLLKKHEAEARTMAEALLERETLDREEIALIMKGEPLPAMEVEVAPPPPVEPAAEPASEPEPPADEDAWGRNLNTE
ncbi:MAG TPA: ATP-dependent zinc metalloprotease FtsH [Candidatus Krumholzibacteria bacterium]|nr:ATP-dependent zinc metalloprotease FtsH [Candidatus Krumholzibacteria bacterium]HRX49819.1 ATP-dependent zinc metalloprotease FtsH [Candidatus Krumholzibacteria bacterium]